MRILFAPLAKRNLEKLDRSTQQQIVSKLDRVAKSQPDRFLIPLKELDAYRVRVGDYRIIVDIDRTKDSTYVLAVGHRRSIYR